jgi:hypothetical protein
MHSTFVRLCVRLCRTWLLPLLGATLLLGGFTGAGLAPTSATFRAIPPINVNSLLNSISLSAPTDAWTVGTQYKDANTIIDTLAEHWNGASWTVVPTPSPHNNVDILSAVADIAPTNAWAVGNGSGSNGFSLALIEHFNGSSWKVVPAAPDTSVTSYLSTIVALSANNIWAAGSHFDSTIGGDDGLFEHWNGTAWSIIPSPSTVTLNGSEYAVQPITSLTAISSNDIWAATGAGSNNPILFEHWNGTQWNLVFAPGITNSSATISGLAASSSTDVWAVGTSKAFGRRTPILPLIEHWNGSTWSIVPSPTLSTPSGFLSGVTTLSSTDAWAVGGNYSGVPVVEHWDGTQWSLVTVPVVAGAANNQLASVSSLPGGTVIAVGPTLAVLSNNG